MTFNAAYLQDPGIRALVRGEGEEGGYEYPARAFLDAHLEPGDLFIDVGAHWGIFSLHAATRHRGKVRVLAIEPHPGNVAPLARAVAANGLERVIEVISVAAGAAPETAPLIFNSTMGHSLHAFGLPAGAKRLGTLTVPVLPLDLIVGERAELANRRIIMKIDVEGYEPEAIAGAEALLAGGRVAAVIWEHGSAYCAAGGRGAAMESLCVSLERHGFRQYRFPHPSMGGPLVPFAPTPECFNVFALSLGDRAPCLLPQAQAPSRAVVEADPGTGGSRHSGDDDADAHVTAGHRCGALGGLRSDASGRRGPRPRRRRAHSCRAPACSTSAPAPWRWPGFCRPVAATSRPISSHFPKALMSST